MLCLRPIHHVMEYEGLYGLLEDLRAAAPEREIRLYLRSAVADPAPFARLPADRVERLGGETGRGDLAWAFRRFLDAREPGGTCVLIAAPQSWRSLVPDLHVAATAALDFRTPPGWECAESSSLFQAALQRESPRWAVAGNAPAASLLGAAPRILIHQARFHLGDTLWLTPLLREVRRRFRKAEITVVGPPAAREALAGNPRLADLQIYQPADGEGGRRQVLASLEGRRFDAALLGFPRRPESAWLAEAVAGWGVPYRIGLEYHDLSLPPGVWEPLTHEGRFFWGTMASPRMLLHLLDPLLVADPWERRFRGDRRVEIHIEEKTRELSHQVLAAHGIGQEPFAVLCPGGASSRRWPAASFARLALDLTAHFGLHVLIEGRPDEAALLEEVAALARSGGPRRAVVASWDPLPVLAALLERARLLVANDSAPIHVAEAVGSPSLYFAQREKLAHSHPRTAACWALWDDRGNDPARITPEQALGAVREMVRGGLVRGLADRPV